MADVSRGWVGGLRQVGCHVLDFNFADRLNFYGAAHVPNNGELVQAFQPQEAAMLASKGIEATCFEYMPDVVVIVSGFFVPPAVYELMRVRGIKVVLVHTECPYEDDRQLARANFADVNVVNDPTNLHLFPKGTTYIPHAYDPAIHYPRPASDAMASDFCFVGTGYPARTQFFEAVDWSGVEVLFGGNWKHLTDDSPIRKFLGHDPDECLPNELTVDLYASTKASVNLYRKEATATADGWAMGPREVELAACNTFFLREAREEGDTVLHMLPTFDGPDDFSEKLRWWLAHDSARETAARLARLAVADRTFVANASRLLNLLGV